MESEIPTGRAKLRIYTRTDTMELICGRAKRGDRELIGGWQRKGGRLGVIPRRPAETRKYGRGNRKQTQNNRSRFHKEWR